MARHTSRSQPRRGGSLFLGVLLGVVFASLLAAGVALWSTDLNPFRTPAVSTERPAPEPDPGEPEAPPPLDFYRALPSDEPLPAPSVAQPPAVREAYFLQAGAFRDAEQADNLKANLAMLGVEAAIVSEETADGALHRVRIGPLASIGAVDSTRALLQQNQIPTVLVRQAPDKKETP